MAQITTSEFAAELGTDTRTVRKFLRSITPKDEQPGKGARWNIEGNKRSLTSMKKRFADWTASQVKPEEPTDEALEAEAMKLAEKELELEDEIDD